MKSVKTAHIIVKGRVHGVGFRYFALHKALDLSLKGTVTNRYDHNDVEIYCQGDEEAINSFIEQIKLGPPLSHVLDIVVNRVIIEEFSDFKII